LLRTEPPGEPRGQTVRSHLPVGRDTGVGAGCHRTVRRFAKA
jgi:hypothetical protein